MLKGGVEHIHEAILINGKNKREETYTVYFRSGSSEAKKISSPAGN
jgi:hypothetical protein